MCFLLWFRVCEGRCLPPLRPPSHDALSVCQWRIPVTMQLVPRRQSGLTWGLAICDFSKKSSTFAAVRPCFLRPLSLLSVANIPRVTSPVSRKASRRVKVRRTNYYLQRPFTSSIWVYAACQLGIKLFRVVYTVFWRVMKGWHWGCLSELLFQVYRLGSCVVSIFFNNKFAIFIIIFKSMICSLL